MACHPSYKRRPEPTTLAAAARLALTFSGSQSSGDCGINEDRVGAHGR